MILTIKLEFTDNDSTSACVALNEEDIAISPDQWVEILRPAIELVRHNAKRYQYLMDHGTLKVMPKAVGSR